MWYRHHQLLLLLFVIIYTKKTAASPCTVPRVLENGDVTRVTIECAEEAGQCVSDKTIGMFVYRSGLLQRELLRFEGVSYCACKEGRWGEACEHVCPERHCTSHHRQTPHARAESCGQLFYTSESFDSLNMWPTPGMCFCKAPFLGSACQLKLAPNTNPAVLHQQLKQTQGILGIAGLIIQPASYEVRPFADNICFGRKAADETRGRYVPHPSNPCECQSGYASTALAALAMSTHAAAAAQQKQEEYYIPQAGQNVDAALLFAQLPMCSMRVYPASATFAVIEQQTPPPAAAGPTTPAAGSTENNNDWWVPSAAVIDASAVPPLSSTALTFVIIFGCLLGLVVASLLWVCCGRPCREVAVEETTTTNPLHESDFLEGSPYEEQKIF